MQCLSGTAILLLAALAAPAWAEPIRLTGRIVPAGAPGARVEIRAYPRKGEAEIPPVTVEPAADGTFVLSVPRAGLYRLTAQAKGLQDAMAPLPVVEDASLPLLFLRDTGIREETSRRGASSSIYKGRVIDSITRAPVPGALVWEAGLDAKEDAVWTWTEADGRFQLPLHGPHPVIGAAAPGYVQIPRHSLEPGSSFMLSLLPAVTLAGQIVDGEGRPVAEASVGFVPVDTDLSLMRPEGREVRSGAEGGFLLRALTPETAYRISVRAEGFVPAWKESSAGKPGKDMPPVRIVLSRGVTVIGRIVDADGQPVAGTDLALMTAADGPEGTGYATWQTLRASSDATGRFRFERVGTGAYQMQAVRPGFARAYRSGTVGTNPQAVVDVGDVPLETGAVIEGRVTDPQGKPLAGAEISGPHQDSRREHLFFSSQDQPTFTAADGSFRISDLERGRLFSFSVQKTGYVLAEVPGVEAPTRELHIELRPARSLSGRVVDAERRPVAGARIARVEVQETGFGDGTSSSRSSFVMGQTDAEGRFSVSGLDPGLLRIEVKAPGFRASELSGIQIPEDEEPSPLEILLEAGAVLEGRVLDGKGQPVIRARVQVLPPDAKRAFGPSVWTDEEGRYQADSLEPGEYRVEAAPFGSSRRAEGKVRLGDSGTYHLDLQIPSGVSVSGSVSGEQGKPLPGAAIFLHGDSPYGVSAVSVEDGSFRLDGVPDGIYRLNGSARGYMDGTALGEVQVEGQEVVGLALSLSRGGIISGRVLGLDEGDRESLQIKVQPDDGGSPDQEMIHFGVVESEGAYRLPPVAPGSWRVTASLGSGLSASGIARVAAPGDEVTLDLEMPRGLALSGRVLLDGQPLAGASVSVFPAVEPGATDGQLPTATTRYDGSFSVRGLRPGRFTLSVLSRSVHHTRPLELAADRDITVEILTGRLTGQVLTAAGTPVEGVILTLRSGEPGEQGVWSETTQTRSDDHGAFEVPRLAAGSYRIMAQAPGFAPVSQTVVVTPGGTTEVQVVLKEE